MDVYWVIFQPDNLTLSPTIPNHNTGRIDPPAGAGAAPVVQVPNETATAKLDILEAIRSINWVSKRTRTMVGQGADQEIAANHDSDVTSVVSSDAKNDVSDYV